MVVVVSSFIKVTILNTRISPMLNSANNVNCSGHGTVAILIEGCCGIRLFDINVPGEAHCPKSRRTRVAIINLPVVVLKVNFLGIISLESRVFVDSLWLGERSQVVSSDLSGATDNPKLSRNLLSG